MPAYNEEIIKISAIVPAYNEEERVLQTIKALKGIKAINEIVVVDDGSTDNTCGILSEVEGIILLRNPANMGKGSAVKSGLSLIKNDYVLLIDADLGSSAKEIEKMIPGIRENTMLVGRFPQTMHKNGFGITKLTAAAGLRLLAKKNCGSLLSGQRIIPAVFLQRVQIPRGYSLEFKLTLEAIKGKINIIEMPLEVHHREYGRSLRGFLHRSGQCKDIINQIIKEVVDDKVLNHNRH